MRGVTNSEDVSQQDSDRSVLGSFHSTGMPDWVDREMDDDEFSRRCDEAEQELAEQQAYAALNDLRSEYGITAMTSVVNKVMQAAGKAVVA